MTVVVDASVAVKWLSDERGSDTAEHYLLQRLIAPSLFRLECANAVIRRLRIGEIDRRRARFLLDEVQALPVELLAVSDAETIRLALELSHYVNDCAYLVLARAERLQLVTADGRFVEAAEIGGYGGDVRLLGQP